VSGFKTYAGACAIILSSFVLMGCPKKVTPVTGSEGLAQGEGQSSATSPQGGSAKSGASRGGTDKRAESGVRSEDMGTSKGQESGGQPHDRHASKSDKGSMSSKSDNGMTPRGKSGEPGMPMDGSMPLKFASDVYFDFDMWTIRSDAKDALTRNARWLVQNPHVKIQIEGHGDERGTNEYNLALGERRARSTKRYLTNLGVSPSRISFISYGEEKNVCNEKTESCFQRNRRAHFVAKK
ncbi:MAG: peptidoglycan-associated lipoprotein Pal, partial [Nitrospiria bacterium]